MHHRIEDLQSFWLHGEAVHLLRQDPQLVQRVLGILDSWGLSAGHSEPLRQAWLEIARGGRWDEALAKTDRGQELRQASPLALILPTEVRSAVLERIRDLKARCRNAGRSS